MAKIKLHFQRFEMKYQLPTELVQGMIPEFLKYMDWDPYALKQPGKAYRVASLYYDTAGLDCYYQKIAGERKRKKLRIRFYDQTLTPESKVFLEIKKKYDAVVVKDRVALSLQNCYDAVRQNRFSHLGLDPNEQASFDEFMWLKLYNGLIPQNLVVYQRKPLISKVDPDFRVTIDYNLRTAKADWLTDPVHLREVNPGRAILEVKFNNVLPFWFAQIIKRYDLKVQAFSKYTNCLENLKPDLLEDIQTPTKIMYN